MKKLLLSVVAIGLSLSLSSVAYATATITEVTSFNLGVGVTVAKHCGVTTITAVAFGPYAGTAVTASGVVTVECSTDATFYKVGLDGGLNLAGSTRRLDDDTTGLELLIYNLRVTSGGSVWGSSGMTVVGDVHPSPPVTNTSDTLVDAGVVVHTVYGDIPGSQLVPPDTYADTVVVILEF